jgi:hypothetical protein
VPSLVKKRRSKRPTLSAAIPCATSSETLIANEQPVTATGTELSVTRAYIKQEIQENTIMNVSWNTIASSPTYVQHEKVEGNPSLPDPLETYHDPWSSWNPSSNPQNWQQQGLGGADYRLNDHRATATHVEETPYEQSCSHEVWTA